MTMKITVTKGLEKETSEMPLSEYEHDLFKLGKLANQPNTAALIQQMLVSYLMDMRKDCARAEFEVMNRYANNVAGASDSLQSVSVESVDPW